MKAAIFDFDGTIVDTETLWVDVYSDLIKDKFQHEVPLEIFQQCVGTKDTALYNYLNKNVDSTISRELLSPLAEKLVGDKMVYLQPREGIIDLITRCKNANLRLAIASGSRGKWIHQFLENANLAHHFEVIRCADDVENVKPHPELYLTTLAALQLNATECFAIEDSINGSQSAISADLKCFVIPNEVTLNANFPNEVILLENFDALPI